MAAGRPRPGCVNGPRNEAPARGTRHGNLRGLDVEPVSAYSEDNGRCGGKAGGNGEKQAGCRKERCIMPSTSGSGRFGKGLKTEQKMKYGAPENAQVGKEPPEAIGADRTEARRTGGASGHEVGRRFGAQIRWRWAGGASAQGLHSVPRKDSERPRPRQRFSLLRWSFNAW